MGHLAASPYVVIGAGMHGLSTAYHLALELERRGLGAGGDVVVVDKATPGAGATGIACGVVRNNYFQPAMSELMQACVEVWESDPEAYHYNGVGYIALGPPVQEPDLVAVFERQERIGYRSELIVGEAEVDAHMKSLFPDWRAKGVTVCLHEHPGWVRLQPRVGRRPPGQVPRGRRPDPGAHRGDGLRARLRRRRRRRRDERRPDRGRRAGRRRPRAVGAEALVDARPPRPDRRAHPVGRRRARPADVDVLEPPGGGDHRRPAVVRHRGRRRTARDPPRHGRAAPHGRRRAS